MKHTHIRTPWVYPLLFIFAIALAACNEQANLPTPVDMAENGPELADAAGKGPHTNTESPAIYTFGVPFESDNFETGGTYTDGVCGVQAHVWSESGDANFSAAADRDRTCASYPRTLKFMGYPVGATFVEDIRHLTTGRVTIFFESPSSFEKTDGFTSECNRLRYWDGSRNLDSNTNTWTVNGELAECLVVPKNGKVQIAGNVNAPFSFTVQEINPLPLQ